jgi:hypothetical protein
VKNSKYTTKASVENKTADTKNNQDIPTSETISNNLDEQDGSIATK